MATNKRTLSRIGFYCGLELFLIITLFPFFVMLMTSFKGAKEAISLHPTLLPSVSLLILLIVRIRTLLLTYSFISTAARIEK